MNQAGEPDASDKQGPPDGTVEPLERREGARARVLVIEDSEDIRYLLAALLQDKYEVLAAAAGDEGLRLAMREPRPDIILLDVMMPDMDGYEVLEHLGRDARTADIPVIFLTALGSVDEEERGLDLGATDYVAKPISPPILLARIKLHLERSINARRLKDLSEQLSRYLAPQVYQSLFDGSRQAEIRTQRKKLTVFFSDIKNFTESTAQWQPEEVTLLLNSYFAEMSQIAAEYGATLDKFIGDAIVIFFGDPHTLGVREDAVQCVNMAIAMQLRMGQLQARWREMGINKAFEIRIGINSGFCDVGNFGSALRMEYTIIGREVNLAARLEQAAEPGEILISSETYALVQREIAAEARPAIQAKGFAHPIPVYVVRPGASTSPGAEDVLRCEQAGMHVEIDMARMTPAQRLDAAAQLRGLLQTLEQAPAAAAALPAAAKPAAGEPAWPLVIFGLDTELGLRRAMGVKTLYVSMLTRFQEGRRDTPAKVRQALHDGDTKTAELLVHSLRGVAGQIGAVRVPLDAGALEQAIHEAQPREVIEGLLMPLEDSLGELMAALDAGLATVTPAP
ncbi:MAG: adenylate/guanylate cyclase domain-containing protein [Polaromonas sp.]|nr:adenylate/guanylate cyclase domain-containing protein [Polaromonas sp.]MDP3752263.1 adenylate/guanylate cyclase domain-containing protein [Polaromonas sp.]